ncbi:MULTISPECIES: OprD family outer membrane porin [unclassified Acinetobacter]|uniref:OprD family outer membrane porin n=1 Tax=unclassified Acinetobacter TaxID=196816 RepID=UPI00140C6A96|nr:MULTISPECIES: OprD family outer membrane porin [unclassified Acinetobacter]NHB64192.1 OprD family porin [Acinetobacter sp. GFQ9D191M]NHC00043.1 OprD family porin [Acinetobacter sp. GFQ9D192M]
MQNTKKLTLAVLIQAALISTAFASEQSESKGFVEDAEGSVLFRTGYLTRDYKGTPPNSDTSSFAQTAIVKLDSGFTQGVVGFGAGIIGDASFKLGKNGHTGNDMIPTHPQDNADGTKDAYDHWARGGAYVKARVSNTTATYGTQVLDLPVLASNTARLVPEYYNGVLIESKEIENLSLVAGKFTENQRSSQINSDGNELDRATVWGAKYKFSDALNASYYGTDIKDRLDRHYVNANYSYDLADKSTLTHDFSGYHTKWDKEANPYLYSQIGSQDDSFDNTILALSTTYNHGPHNVMVAYQQNFGNTGYDYGLGRGVGDGHQTIYMPNSYLSDFIGNDEKSAQLQYTYDFKGLNIPGLTWTTAYVYGWDIKATDNQGNMTIDNAKESEFFNQVKYTVQSGFAKDASLRLRHSFYRADQLYNDAYMPDTNEWRIWLDIPVKLF